MCQWGDNTAWAGAIEWAYLRPPRHPITLKGGSDRKVPLEIAPKRLEIDENVNRANE